MKKLELLRQHISESNELDESEKIRLFRFVNVLVSPPVSALDPVCVLTTGEALSLHQKEETLCLKETIGEHLRQLRAASGLSREGMSALIGIGRGTLDVAERPRTTKRTLAYKNLSDINALYLKAIQAKREVLDGADCQTENN